MDCQTVRQLLDLLPVREEGSRTVEAKAVQEHLSTCLVCQAVARDIRDWDTELQQVMQAVSVPEGLRERLLCQLEQSVPRLAPATEPVPQRQRHTVRWISGLALGLSIAVASIFWASQPGKLTLSAVVDSAAETLRHRPASELGEFDGSFSIEISAPGWQQICEQPPIGWDIDQRPGHDLAAYRINIPSLRFGGWLVMVPVSRISDVPLSSTPVKLSYTQATWRDEKYVYVCVAGQGGIDQLLSLWQGGAA